VNGGAAVDGGLLPPGPVNRRGSVTNAALLPLGW
jgi:hypothetical protein